MNSSQLNNLSEVLISYYAPQEHFENNGFGITVSPIVSKLAEWYENLRNSMEYRQEEVIFQNAVRRILARKILLKESKIAESLVRELVWAKYIPEGEVTEDEIDEVQEIIALFLDLKKRVKPEGLVLQDNLSEWITDVLSSILAKKFSPTQEKEAMINYIFHALQENLTIQDEEEEIRDVQLYVAIRRVFAKENTALLRQALFQQYFGKLTRENFEEIAEDFDNGFDQIEKTLEYKGRFKIQSYVKQFIPPFLILDQVLRENKENLKQTVDDQEKLHSEIVRVCHEKYGSIKRKVNRAIFRSLIFLTVSKAVVVFVAEGTLSRILYGEIAYTSIAINVIVPITIMTSSALFMGKPDHNNTKRIAQSIENLLFSPKPKIGYPIRLKNPYKKNFSIMNSIFTILWLGTFILSFGLIISALRLAKFNLISTGVFVFFLTIVSFLIYRIYQSSKTFTFLQPHSVRGYLVDFFLLPIARVGRYLTEGFAQINVFLLIVDFIIETPFKAIFAFTDQWLLFLRSKRENLE